MKNLKKLVIASFMLVIAFVAVVSSTYAWFTQGGEAKVENITVGVVDSNKAMLISKDKLTWGKSVSLSYTGKLNPATADAFANGELSFREIALGENGGPLAPSKELFESTVTAPTEVVASNAENHDEAWVAEEGTEQEIAAAVEANNTNYSNAAAYRAYLAAKAAYDAGSTAQGGYIKFDLYFQVSVNASGDWAGTYIDMDLSNLHAYNVTLNSQTNEYEEGTVDNQRAISSFRLAVVEHGTEIRKSFIEDQTEVNTAAEGQTAVYVGGGRYGSGDQFLATNRWMQLYDQYDLVEAGTPYTLATGVNKTALYSDTQALDIADGTGTANHHEYVLACNTANVYETVDDTTRVFHITVYAWMEGWDGDNINAASGVNYHFDLTFKTR